MRKTKKQLGRIVKRAERLRGGSVVDGLTPANKKRVFAAFAQTVWSNDPEKGLRVASKWTAFKPLKQYQQDIHAYVKAKGWWEKPRNVGELLALLHSEVSEALEEYRMPGKFKPNEIRFVKGKPEGFGIELADLFIRLMDMCEGLGIDMEKMVEVKMAFNEKRPYRHGGKKA